ncbi:response regulator [Variovorax sp. J22R133]|uniref:response regulator n=1 Tax=Variovorax brevis TaxID=3053503 RepID=UPI0025758CFD|nr:response regulator [Variovorax sp. J22R133]MDM0117744.1 response regulator [Variovorax sp. J22R133]
MHALQTFLVEDSQTIRDNLIPTMEELGVAQVIAFAAREDEAVAWLLAHTSDWHAAVVDVFLQQGSGLGVVRACRNRKPHQHVLVLTNYATAEIRRQCLALGANAVFDKSTELEALFEYCAEVGASDERNG